MERAREALKEGEDLIIARQKAIRIADLSEYGWAKVEEYEEDKQQKFTEKFNQLFNLKD